MDTLLIGIEGSDGVGKATQSALLKDWLELRDLSVANISFPRYNEKLTPIIFLRLVLMKQVSIMLRTAETRYLS